LQREGSNLLVEVDLALDLKRETDPAECYRRLRWEPLVALEFTLRQTLSYCLLNLALGSHTQPLEKLADAGIENVFVHRRLHVAACCWSAATLERGAVSHGYGFI
jgi:hypothetical protein